MTGSADGDSVTAATGEELGEPAADSFSVLRRLFPGRIVEVESDDADAEAGSAGDSADDPTDPLNEQD